MRNTANRKDALAALRAALITDRDKFASKDPEMIQVLTAPQNVAMEDQIPLLHEQFIALSRHSRDRQTLALIHSALERFDRGEYGICENCEGEISMKRLQAVPWALRCVPCQELSELGSDRNTNLTRTAYG